MKYTVKNRISDLSDSAKRLARRLGVSNAFLSLLLARGIREEDVDGYLHPSLADMGSPFEIDGMREAAKRVKRAIQNKERVLIYGDYDCDGICAISILMLYLRDKLDAWYFIPDRTRDGYGVTKEALDRSFAAKKPDLVITVDCGVTAVSETEYIKDQGIDVIVTDHHEPQDAIPDCIVVDPKIGRKGFFELCGAGVALKLVEALSSREEASKYLDIAAIATIADIVPLVKDNRVIAYYGLKRLATSPRKGVRMLLMDDGATSQDVMFKLAPRMNAAGRLGSAMKVVDLFLEDDYFMLKTLAEELARDNARRQDMCEAAVNEAKAMLKGVDFNDVGIIALENDGWEAGILGIAAAKLVEEFKRPAVLFTRLGDSYKGSARSVPSVNIFELFSELNEYFTSFGGHAQAAGVGMLPQNFEPFKEAANRLVLKEHSLDEFLPSVVCEAELKGGINFLAFAKELELMEPTGYANPKPTFLYRGHGLRFDGIGFSPHVKTNVGGLDIIGFSRFTGALSYPSGDVDLEVTLGTNTFQNNVTAQALIRSVGQGELSLSDGDADCLNVHQLEHEEEPNVEGISVDEVERFLEKPFGTMIVVFKAGEYEALKAKCKKATELPLYVGCAPSLDPENAVVLCPSESFDFKYFNRAVIAGDPLCAGYIGMISRQTTCFALDGVTINRPYVSDDTLRAIYREMSGMAKRRERAQSPRKLYQALCSRYKTSEQTFYIATRIFDALGTVRIGDRGALIVSNKPVKLENSAVYRNLLHKR